MPNAEWLDGLSRRYIPQASISGTWLRALSISIYLLPMRERLVRFFCVPLPYL